MGRRWRTVATILDASLAADRRLTVIAAVLSIVGWIVIPFQALAIKLFIDAIVRRDSSGAVVAVTLAAVTMGGLWYFNNLRGFVNITLRERTTHELDVRLQGLAGGIPGIEHLERPEYLDRLATLRAQGHSFGNIGDVLSFPALTLNVVVSAILLASVDPVLLVVPFAMGPAIYLSGRSERVLRAAEEEAAPARRLRARMLVMATDSSVAGEARLFDARAELVRRHAAADQRIDGILARAGVANVVLTGAGWAVYALAFGFVLVVAVGGIRAGRLVVGDLFLAYYLVRGLTWQTQYFLYSIGDVQRTIAATSGYLWLADHAAAAREATGAGRPMPGPGELRFDHVSFRYPGAEHDVLSDVELAVPAGAVLALVGDNGAGKTTLVKLLARFYAPTEGRITLAGQDIGEVDVAAWRLRLTACFQDFCRFELVTRETVGVGDLERVEDSAVVAAAVADAGAGDVVAGLQLGLATPLGASWPEGAEPSVGQWQKLALARAMMRIEPRLLLLDEPTAALDAAAEARLFERYEAASAFARATGSITVIVSHRMSTVRTADLIAVVANGRVTEVGTHAELLARDGAYRELYLTQAASYR